MTLNSVKMQCKKYYHLYDDDGDIFCEFFVGDWYEITKLSESRDLYYTMRNGQVVFFSTIYVRTNYPFLNDYFYTQSDIRKMKLEKIENI